MTFTNDLVDVTPPVISTAVTNMVVEEDDINYIPPTATAIDDISGDVSASISTNDTVNIAIPGLYTVTYTVLDAAGNEGRLIVQVQVVVGNRPVIFISGANPLFLEAGTTFIDPGGNITDTLQPDLSQHLQSNAAIAFGADKLGTYEITYTMAKPDRQGLTAAPVLRTVVVQDTIAPVSYVIT